MRLVGFVRRLLCRLGAPLGMTSHRPERVFIPPWSGFRCARCGTTAETEGELLHLPEPDWVDVVDRNRKERDR